MSGLAVLRSLADATAGLSGQGRGAHAIVALANELARMAWAVLTKNEVYRPPPVAGTTI